MNHMIKVASFLSLSEVESVKNELTGRRIEYFVSSKGTAPGQFDDPYYQVSVNATDYIVARKIVAQTISKSFIEGRKCPKCKGLTYRQIEKKNVWERIYYLGTTRVQCQKCKAIYIV